MSDQSKIEWTNATWNPVRGCTKISPGCLNCYAATFAERWRGVPGHPYEDGFDLRLVPEKLDEPLRWKRPRRIFVNSMSDLFHDGVPEEFIGRMWSKMLGAHWHTFQVLTKRPERMCQLVNRLVEECRRKGLRDADNIWLGTSIENQKYADERIPWLVQTKARIRFLSVEPMLGLIDLGLDGICPKDWGLGYQPISHFVHWVIVGGESGPRARPCHLNWIRDIVRQCWASGVPLFVKQMGAHCIDRWEPVTCGGGCRLVPHLLQTKNRKGGDPSEWPEDIRVREFPST